MLHTHKMRTAMASGKFANIDLDEHTEKGMALYRENIRPLVYPAQKGRMLVIDPESGDYEIDDRAIVASQRLRERHPDALFFTTKIGYKASISFGGCRLPEEEC